MVVQVIFFATYQSNKVRIKLTTYNPKHRSTFLVHTVETEKRLEGLQKLLQYVKTKLHGPEHAYTVTWAFKSDEEKPKLVESYFYAHDIYSLLDKFFYEKNRDEYIIYQIKLNAQS